MRTGKGTLTIIGVLKDSETRQEFSKQVKLPEGLVTSSMQCFHCDGKIHAMAMLVKARREETKTPEIPTQTEESSGERKETAEATPEISEHPCDSDGAISKCPVEGCSAKAAPASAEDREESTDVAMDFEMVSETTAGAIPLEDEENLEALVMHTEDKADPSEPEDGGAIEAERSQAEYDSTGVLAEEADCDKTCTDVGRCKEVEKGTTGSGKDQDIVPQKYFHKKFNMHGFEPSEMRVKLSGRHLTVTAEHREETDNFVNFRQYRQTVVLPDNILLAGVTSRLSSDGVLNITAPVAEQAITEERLLDIQFE